MSMILDLFAERIRHSGESADIQPHRQILAFNEARADVPRVGISRHDFFGQDVEFGRTVTGGSTALASDTAPVVLLQHRIAARGTSGIFQSQSIGALTERADRAG